MVDLVSPDCTCVCAVIVTHNIGEAIHKCVDSVRDQVGHIVAIDNGSDEPTRRELDKLSSTNSVTIILNERNEGTARALNQGVQWALGKGFQWVLTLDHDSKATPGMVDKLLHAHETLCQQGYRDVGIIGANPFDENGHVYLEGYRPGETDRKPIEREYLISSGSMIAGRVFDRVGLFDETFFIYYVDDDFCVRLRRSGFRLFLCAEAVLLHREGRKETKRFFWRRVLYDNYGKCARYYITRNAIYLMKKHDLGFNYSYLLVRRLVTDHIKLLLYDKELFPKLRFSLNGLADGLRGRFGPMPSQSTYDKWGS
jgi:rhamnosyltransferase